MIFHGEFIGDFTGEFIASQDTTAAQQARRIITRLCYTRKRREEAAA